MEDPRGDDELLREDFAVFYRRHVRPLLAYHYRRTGDAELAADLTAETFAAALDGAHRFRPERGPAVGWLYGIARRQLGHALQRGVVEDRARRRPLRFLLPAAGTALAALAAALVLTAGGDRGDRVTVPHPPGGGATFQPQLAVGAGYCPRPSAPRTIAAPRRLREMLALLRRPQHEPDGLPTLNTRGGVKPGDLSWLPLDAWAPRGTRMPMGTVISREIHVVPGTGDGSYACARAGELRGAGPRACVVSGPAGGPFGLACFTAAQIRAGRAMAYFGSPQAASAHVIGIARDGVAGVRLQGDGAPVDAPVSENVFDALVPRTRMGRPLTVSRVPASARVAILNGTTTPGLRPVGRAGSGDTSPSATTRTSRWSARACASRPANGRGRGTSRAGSASHGWSRSAPARASWRPTRVVVVLGRMR